MHLGARAKSLLNIFVSVSAGLCIYHLHCSTFRCHNQFLKFDDSTELPFFAVLNALLTLITEPEPEHPLRAELAEEYVKDRKKFMKNAEDHTKKHGLKRPDGY